jgi:DNA repair protein RadC
MIGHSYNNIIYKKNKEHTMKNIKDIPKFDRPREKMDRNGPQVLSDIELLAVLLGSGIKGKDVFKVARDILKLVQKDFNGVGAAKASQIIAAIEFSKRFLIKDRIKITCSNDIIKMTEELKDKKQEYFLTFTLDGAHNLIEKRTVFIGTLNQNLVHPREIFADAITDRAAGILFVHNHPSGNTEPSKGDISITDRLIEVGKLMGINVVDHIIVSKDGYFSFNEKGMINREGEK